ncbi:hypothetical protein AB0N73_15310 [Microbacterium sp. NPDC089189]|uniref:hypothetical protein n=1 Tax=Microbacterium sp. NPDC089189 TaxID=3154972 RepID=UPI0034232DE0
MDKKKWLTYGVGGVLGAGILAGGATVAAQAMELRTSDGQVLPGGAITGRESAALDADGVLVRLHDDHVSIVSAPEPQQLDADDTVPSVPSVPEVAPPPAPAPEAPVVPAPQAPADSAPSIVSAPSN